MHCFFIDPINFAATKVVISGEDFEGQGAGFEPENPTFPQNHSDEHDAEYVFESGFPPPQPDESFDGYHAGNVAEDSNSLANHFGAHDVGDWPQNQILQMSIMMLEMCPRMVVLYRSRDLMLNQNEMK